MIDLARKLTPPLIGLGFHQFDGTRDLSRGTSFPASADIPGGLLAGDRFWRTDLDFACFYDGARWLTMHEYYVPIVLRQAVAVTNTLFEKVIRTDFAPYITRTITLTNVAAPNTGANYWTVTIQGINTARSAGSTIETFNTSLDTAAVETLRDNVPGTSQTPTNRTLLRVIVQITVGAPGAITIAQSLYFRLIVT
jgi:hypothetical protein